MASSAATLRPTKLERDLSRCDVPLTDRQQRLVTDLRMLRQLFQKVWMTLYLFGLIIVYNLFLKRFQVEQLDPTNALNFVHWLRKDPDVINKNDEDPIIPTFFFSRFCTTTAVGYSRSRQQPSSPTSMRFVR
jgi:hypothetical protein